MNPKIACHACGAEALERIDGYADLRRITSDCRPWPAGGELAVCAACGLAQKPVDRHWRQEVQAIYDAYAIYRLSGGAEQAVFTEGAAQARSARILGWLRDRAMLPGAGSWLDLGCGNGGLLRTLSRELPGWELHGQEIGDAHREEVEAIPGVRRMHVGPPDGIDGTFGMLSLVHVLEHIPDPARFLAGLARLLAPEGRLLIEVPDAATNPFDLLIADHASHFSPATLAAAVEAAGFGILDLEAGWVPKELTLLAGKAGRAIPAPRTGTDPGILQAGVDWLRAVAADAVARAAAHRPFGVFGTSIAGTWLASQLDRLPDFFVDEDPVLAGRNHLGRPILAPEQVPAGSLVYLAFPSSLAARIRARLQTAQAKWSCQEPPDQALRVRP